MTLIVMCNPGTISLVRIEHDLEMIVFGEPYTVPEIIDSEMPSR